MVRPSLTSSNGPPQPHVQRSGEQRWARGPPAEAARLFDWAAKPHAVIAVFSAALLALLYFSMSEPSIRSASESTVGLRAPLL